MVPRWQFLATFLSPAFPASRVQQVSDLHLKFALRPHHVDIQSTAAEIRRGKKERKKERKKKELECGPIPNLMVALPNTGGALCSTLQSLADAHY